MKTLRCLVAFGVAVGVASAVRAQGESLLSGSNGSGPFNGLNINSLLGADRLYGLGYTGSRSVVANIEAGLTWNGHAALGHAVALPVANGFGGTQLGQFDPHATWTGYAIAARPTRPAHYYQQGIAYGATFWTGAVATKWNSFADFEWGDDRAFIQPYLQAIESGQGGRTADVVNGSWGDPSDHLARLPWTVSLDALAQKRGATFVWAAGNTGPGANSVYAPASGYNSLSVGALRSDTGSPPYASVSSFSSRGPIDFFNPVTGVVTPQVRARVDLVAPGENLTLGSYRGKTGGANPGAVPGDPASATNEYDLNMAGTSFAAPIVAGGATLLCDVGRDLFAGNAQAIHATTVKAVLMNAADKLPGWDNGQTDLGGVVTTTQGLDWAQGAGRMNLDRAFDQYTAGTTDLPGLGGGTVQPLGWDYGQVGLSGFTDYLIGPSLSGGTTFTATLDWFVHRTFDYTLDGDGNPGVDGDGFLTGTRDVAFVDLDLELYRVLGGGPPSLVARSASLYNNAEHFSFALPETGQYLLRVAWSGVRYDQDNAIDRQEFSIAWSGASAAPEPASLVLVAVGLAFRGRRLRRPRLQSP